MLCYSQRLRDRARNRLATPHRSSGRVLFDAAAEGGAQALSLPLAPSRRVDGPTSSSSMPTTTPLVGRTADRTLDSWIFAAASSPIASVYLGGKRVVENGRHVARSAIEASFGRAMKRLAAELRLALGSGFTDPICRPWTVAVLLECSMSQPLVVSIPHQLGREEATRRLKSRHRVGAREIWIDRLHPAGAVDGRRSRVQSRCPRAERRWNGACVDSDVILSVRLPWLLARFAEKAQTLLQKQGHLMLEKK